MSKHVRIRCPVCGFLGTQKRLDGKYDFELIIQNTTSRGRGRITNEYYYPENEQGVWLLKLALIEKLEAVTRQLKDELRDEKSHLWTEKFYAGEYDEARQVSSTYHADFSEMLATVESLEGLAVQIVKLPSKSGMLLAIPSTSESPVPLVSRIGGLLTLPFHVDEVESDDFGDGGVEEVRSDDFGDGGIVETTLSASSPQSVPGSVRSRGLVGLFRSSSQSQEVEDEEGAFGESKSRIEEH